MIIFVLYMLAMLVVGVYFLKKNKSHDDYYVGNRKMNSWHIGLSVMATDVGGSKWKDKTPSGFKFFPKITQSISHFHRLKDVDELTTVYCDAITHFEEKLGMCFLQLHESFSTNEFEKLKSFVENFPKVIPLAVEVRNKTWFENKKIWSAYCDLLWRHSPPPT